MNQKHKHTRNYNHSMDMLVLIQDTVENIMTVTLYYKTLFPLVNMDTGGKLIKGTVNLSVSNIILVIIFLSKLRRCSEI